MANCAFLLKRCLSFILFILAFKAITAQEVPMLAFQPVNNTVITATHIVNAGDGSKRFFVTLRPSPGIVKVFDSTFTYIGDFIKISDVVSTGGEQGLLSIAFHPNYKINGYFYVYYTGPNSNLILARYTRSALDSNRADTTTRAVLMSIPKPIDFVTGLPQDGHNGGTLNFGPEGYLYLSIGDGGSGYDPHNLAQDGNSLFGKMLRLDVSNPDSPYYYIPSNNPYISNPTWKPELWSIGLRNPFKWSFDHLTHDMWIADVGQRDREEVDYRPAGNTGGGNFGWKCYEGSIPTPSVPPCTSSVTNYVPPIFEYAHDSIGGSAIIGGYVYRGSQFSDLQGYYICGDFVSKNLWLIKNNGATWNVTREHVLPSTIYTFGEGEDGELYIAGNQGIFKIILPSNDPLPLKLVSFTLRQEVLSNQINWKTANEINIREFTLEYSTDGIIFKDAAKPIPAKNINGSSYSTRHIIANDKHIFYRLKISELDNRMSYSRVISTYSKNYKEPLRVYPTITSGDLQVEINTSFSSIRIYNIFGQLIHQELTGGRTGVIYLNTANWAKGMYTIVADNAEIHVTKKFIVH